jgi:hypothetical protein
MGFWYRHPRLKSLGTHDNGDDMTCIAFGEHEFSGIAGVSFSFIMTVCILISLGMALVWRWTWSEI